MSQDKKSYKRKHYYTHKEFQFRFIVKFCLLLLAGIIISTVLLLLLSQDTLTSSFQDSRLVIKNTAMIILPSVILTNLITLGVITLATIFVTLFVSHKMFGPMLRLKKELQAIEQGDLTGKITLRGKDQLTDIAENINVMITSLNDKISAIHARVANMRKSAPDKNISANLTEQLSQLEQFLGSNFKI